MKSLLLAVLLAVSSTSFAATLEPLPDPGVLYVSQALVKKQIFVNVPGSFIDAQDLKHWGNIVNAIYEAVPLADQIELTFNIQGVGGRIDQFLLVTNALDYAKSKGLKVHMRVVGPSYSAHAFLTCYGDDTAMTPSGSLLVHSPGLIKSYFAIFSYKTNSVDEEQIVSAVDSIYATCINKQILTPAQVAAIKDDKEIIILPINDTLQKVITKQSRDDMLTGVKNAAISLVFISISMLMYLIFLRKLLQFIKKSWRDA